MDKVITLIGSDDCEAQGTPTPVSSRVLKRLGEASAGYPNEEPYWFVCPRYPKPGQKVGEYLSCTEAKDAIPDAELYVAVGPIFTPKRKSESSKIGGPRVDTPLKTITLAFDDANIQPITLSAKEWDALFWGPVSVDKFAVPYYVGASGIEYGVAVNDAFHGKMSGSPPDMKYGDDEGPTAYALVHEPDTDYTVFVLPGMGFVGEPEELLI